MSVVSRGFYQFYNIHIFKRIFKMEALINFLSFFKIYCISIAIAYTVRYPPPSLTHTHTCTPPSSIALNIQLQMQFSLAVFSIFLLSSIDTVKFFDTFMNWFLLINAWNLQIINIYVPKSRKASQKSFQNDKFDYVFGPLPIFKDFNHNYS